VTDEGFRSGFAALIGRPNVGKSTLLNALVGEKVAIVSPRPQTTRRRVLGIRTTTEAQVIFVDTPGIHEPRHQLGRYMVKVARQAIPDADVVLWVVDVAHAPRPEDLMIARLLRPARRPVILVLNKSDLVQADRLGPQTEAFQAIVEVDDWFLTVATRGHNVDKVWAAIVACLPPGPLLFPADQVTDQTDRMFVAELIREAALHHLADEVPHGIEVLIEEWAPRPNGMLFIAAKILVERESPKAIAIGKNGQMLKQIGRDARRQIEASLDERVFLELFVSVRAGWRKSAEDLRRLGFR
jgi:GTPase